MSEHPPSESRPICRRAGRTRVMHLPRKREELFRILATEGPIDDRDGLLVGRLAERLGYRITQTLSMVIKGLESAGLIRRDVAGRRTYRLEIVLGVLTPEDRARLSYGN